MLFLIEVTDECILKYFKILHKENAPCPIEINEDGLSNDTLSHLLQL